MSSDTQPQRLARPRVMFSAALLALVCVLPPASAQQAPQDAEGASGTTQQPPAGAETAAGAEAPAAEAPAAEPAAEGAPAESQQNPSGGDSATASETAPAANTPPPPLPSFLDTTDRRITDTRPPPSPQQVAALEQMEAEVERFGRAAASYRETVVSLVRREYLRQRRNRDQWYARQTRAEEELLDESREQAIRMFERFVRRYPNDARYTPDAMFRLGELYYERSAIQFEQAFDAARAARDAGQTPVTTQDTPDFMPTVDLYRRLVRDFPDYRRVDGVLYLIGYCLNEMGHAEGARDAWLALVCSNQNKYDPEAPIEGLVPADDPDGEEEPGDDSRKHPSLTLDESTTRSSRFSELEDPYRECLPVFEDARFVSETWFRIGEFHFDDYSDPKRALQHAISAYNRILAKPDDRNYNLALYKVAWAYYRANRYPEATDHFGKLVQWSDDERKRTGRAGSDLRPEAVRYLAIAFAYDDWNENMMSDPIEGMPRGIDRLQDAKLMPQDREWTPEVYFQLGEVYFEEAKYPEAIEVWSLGLKRWPMHHRAPEVTNMIARAHVRHSDMEAAIEWRAKLGEFGEGSAWEDANKDHPGELRKALELAENALIGSAVHYHQEAQELRRMCVAQQDLKLCQQAQENYALAAKSYREYLSRYPNNPQAYELQYNLADALYWSENYPAAADEYAKVRDSNLDDSHLGESARRVVESLKRLVEQAQERGEVTVRNEPPEAAGKPPQVNAIAMPDLVQQLAQGREIYLARVDKAHDQDSVRDAYDYNNTLLLYFYGYWPQAKERFQRIFEERCTGADADETGKVAWTNLRNIAASLEDEAEIDRLAKTLEEKQCSFSADGKRTVDCAKKKNENEPECIAKTDIVDGVFRQALAVYRRAEQSSGQEKIQLYEQASRMLVEAVNNRPDHAEAPIALEYAAGALEMTSRFESAARIYQRIVDEIGPRKADTPEKQAELDAILANAYFRLAYNSNRFFDFDRAVENYRLLADSSRFAKSRDEKIQKNRQDALINAAIILEQLQQYRRAATYYDRASRDAPTPADRRLASYRLAEMSFKRKAWRPSIDAMRSFIARYGRDKDAGELVVQAHWRIAEATKERRASDADYRRALQAVVDAYARSGQEPASIAAEYAGQARFLLADKNLAAFERFAIRPGKPGTLERYVGTVADQIKKGVRSAKELADGYNPVLEYRRPTWTVAAFVRQGRVYEVLARAVLNTPFVMPNDLAKKVRRLGPDAREEIRIQVEDRIRMLLDEQTRPIECLAVARYALASRASRAGSIDNEYTQQAIDRLQAYGDERIAECVAEVQKQDSTFKAYQPGEFKRAPRGRQLKVDPAVTPPPMSPGGGS